MNTLKKGRGRKLVSGIYKLIDGSLVQKVRFDNIANNLANINTSGFKRDIIAFDQALAESYKSQTDYSLGPSIYTGNELDIALNTKGFFKVMTPRGVRYTRNGSFSLNRDRVLVTNTGDEVMGQNGTIRIDGNNVSIAPNGQIMVDNQPVDQLLVVDFDQL